MARLSAILNRGVLLNLALTAGVFALLLAWNRQYDLALRDVQYFNGWALAGVIVVMMLLTMRKRAVILPFGRVRFWLLVHYYLSILTIGAFLIHTRMRLPDSPLEWLLWCLFVVVAVSGIFGAFFTRYIPPRLEAHGERIMFERIPVFRTQLAAEAEALARDSVRDGTASIAKLYSEVLGHYFAGPRNVLAHLQSSRVPLNQILDELASIERYLDGEGKARLARMRELVETKDNLDFQYANAGLLRVWLFLHLPPTYAMLVIAVVHVVLAYAFSARVD
jgi:hypothetical protein